MVTGITRRACILFALLACTPAGAQQKGMADHVYFLGRVQSTVPLNLFAGPDLQQACADLAAGRRDQAARAFAAALERSPGNLPAIIGLIQAAPERRNALRQTARKHIEKGGAAADYLAAGLIDLYEWGRLWPGPILTVREVPGRSALRSTARAYLAKAYELSHEAVAGFVQFDASEYLGGPAPLQDVAERAGGPEFANQYRRAKALSWKVPVPGVPNVPKDRLRVLERALAKLGAPYQGIHTGFRIRTVNRVDRVEHYIAESDPAEDRAARFHAAWQNKIRAVIGKPPFDLDKWRAEARRYLIEDYKRREKAGQ